MTVRERVAQMTEKQVREALIDIAEAATSDPEALTVDTEEIVSALELHDLNIYGEGYDEEEDDES